MGLEGKELQNFVKEEQDRQRDERQKDREREREKEEKDREERERDRHRQAELEKERIALERFRIESEIESARQNAARSNSGNSSAPNSTKIPVFNERNDELDAYLHRFELIATSKNWNKDTWAGVLANLLTGSALSVLHSLSLDQARDYDVLKNCLLKHFKYNADGYRSRFRSAQVNDNENFDSFVSRLGKLLDRWLELDNVPAGDFLRLRELIIKDQIYQSCNNELVTFLKERNPKNLSDLKTLADQYAVAHPHKTLSKPNPLENACAVSTQPPRGRQPRNQDFDRTRPRSASVPNRNLSDNFQNRNFSTTRRDNTPSRFQSRPNQYRPRFENQNYSSRRDYGWRDNNPRNSRNTQRSYDSSAYHCVTSGNVSCENTPQSTKSATSDKHNVESQQSYATKVDRDHTVCSSAVDKMQYACTSLTTGPLPYLQGKINGKPCTVLKDTGCTCCGVHKNFVKPSDYTGRTSECQLYGGAVVRFPTAIIHIETPLYTGTVEAHVLERSFADLILGNIYEIDSITHRDNGDDDTDRDKDHIDHYKFDKKSHLSPPVQTKPTNKTQNNSDHTVGQQRFILADLTADDFRNAQQSDPGLADLLHMANTGHPLYCMENGVLFRTFYKKGRQHKQVVVPTQLRNKILVASHESISSGHLGISATKKKIFPHFTWRGIIRDIRQHVRTCKVCKDSAHRKPSLPLRQDGVNLHPFDKNIFKRYGIPSHSHHEKSLFHSDDGLYNIGNTYRCPHTDHNPHGRFQLRHWRSDHTRT